MKAGNHAVFLLQVCGKPVSTAMNTRQTILERNTMDVGGSSTKNIPTSETGLCRVRNYQYVR